MKQIREFSFKNINWVNFINSFQATDSKFPNNSYIDKNLVDSIKSFNEGLKYDKKCIIKIKYQTL